MTKDEALNKIATVNAMDYEYQAWAREALTQPCGLECDCTDVCKQIDYKALWQQMCERCDELDKKLAQLEYKSTSDHQFMENAQGELERIKLVQTGVGIEQRAEEAYEAAKHRSWVGVSDEVAQPEQDWIERERAVGYREGHMAALSQRTWIGLPMEEFKFIASKYLLSREVGLEYFQEEIESKLKELNT